MRRAHRANRRRRSILSAAVMLGELAKELRGPRARLVLAQAIGQVGDVLDKSDAEPMPCHRTIDETNRPRHRSCFAVSWRCRRCVVAGTRR